MKKRNVFNFIVVLCLLIVFGGCTSSDGRKVKSDEIRIIGNAKDSHGCLTSAGYQWSSLLKDCIRPFEKGMKLEGQGATDHTMAAYLVFNVDSSQVEVFLPGIKENPVLQKMELKGITIWKGQGSISVSHHADEWLIKDKNQVIFKK